MGAHGWDRTLLYAVLLLYAVHQMLSLVPCTGTVSGAAGHNRWGVVERRLPAKTQGRTATTYCCRVVLLMCRCETCNKTAVASAATGPRQVAL